MTVHGPELKSTTVALIDGLNVARARPNIGRVVFEDLLGCVEFFQTQGVKSFVFLDENDRGLDVLARLLPNTEHSYAWLCTHADPVILELAALLTEAVIVSGDDFAEFQTHFASVLFAPGRLLAFDPTNGPGDGNLRFRRIREKPVQQLGPDEAIVENFPVIVHALLELNCGLFAEQFCHKARETVAKASKENTSLCLIDYLDYVARATLGKGPNWLARMRLSRKLNTHLKQSVSLTHNRLYKSIAAVDQLLKNLDSKQELGNQRKAIRQLQTVWNNATPEADNGH